MKKIVFVLIVLFWCHGSLFSVENYLLKGKIGNSDIYMSVNDYSSGNVDDDETLDALYFYVSSLKDIVMRGNREGGKYVLYVNKSENGYDEKFVLSKNAAGEFKGTWNSANGKRLSVSLVPTSVQDIDHHPYGQLDFIKNLKQEDAFNYIRSGLISFVGDSVADYKGKSFVWFKESHCNAPFFRLGNGFSTETLQAVNPKLDEIHLYNAISQLSCSAQWYYNEGNSIEYTIRIEYLTDNLLGFSVFSSWFCGGAHPDFGEVGYLLDLNNGKEYEIDEVLAFDQSVTTESQGGFSAFSEYRSNYFGPGVFKLVNQIEKFEKPDPEEDDCDYTELEYWDFPSWHFTEEGIVFTPIFYRAARNCETGFLVPFSDLRKYKRAGFPYDF
ncbi:MAG: hypothetical protein FWF54_10130 [Candidatus Azobacteroides sp.]|nr:hypothetical protein [Candidatus Azobacteroides sp.]